MRTSLDSGHHESTREAVRCMSRGRSGDLFPVAKVLMNSEDVKRHSSHEFESRPDTDWEPKPSITEMQDEGVKQGRDNHYNRRLLSAVIRNPVPVLGLLRVGGTSRDLLPNLNSAIKKYGGLKFWDK